jgi:AraC-like DNA-binding protein
MPLDLQRWQPRINVAGRVRTQRGWRLSADWGPRFADFDIWFVWAGQGWLRTAGKTHTIRPGFCLWARGGTVYEAGHDDTQSLGVNYIHFDLYDQKRRWTDMQSPALPREVFEVQDVSYVDSVTRRIGRLHADEATRPLACTLMSGLLHDLVYMSAHDAASPRQAEGYNNPRLAAVLRLAARLKDDPGRAASVRQMAVECGCGADHFSKLFKQATGLSPQEYLIEARITKARELLTETSMKVRDIALSLGYCDEFFFARQFKQRTGQTAREARQTHTPR